MPVTDLDIKDIRRRWRGYSDLASFLIELVRLGWRVTPQGHGGRLYCPHGHPEHMLSFAGTPRNEGREVRRLKKFVATCVNGAQN